MNTAEVKILIKGYSNADSIAETGEEKTQPTITLVKDKDIVMVVDPGLLEDQQVLADELAKEGLTVNDINYVCITHSHLDHYRNIGMFGKAKALDYWGIWDKNTIEDWQEQFTENIRILKTPGHDYTSITLFVKTDQGTIAICGDVFWRENEPEIDMFSQDQSKLAESRRLVLKLADFIIPGHGPMYRTENGKRLLQKKQETKTEKKIIGTCRKCRRPFQTPTDRCACQEWLCYRCCECDIDSEICICNCKHRIK